MKNDKCELCQRRENDGFRTETCTGDHKKENPVQGSDEYNEWRKSEIKKCGYDFLDFVNVMEYNTARLTALFSSGNPEHLPEAYILLGQLFKQISYKKQELEDD